ncbi:hypothetical protein [Bradyrhizobium liaoningense]|uniref:hypothetical protein n=1 Tax=Bradyrhizobium liaoningense TaxID=43992 RepID=UPI001BA7BEAE|nr:hypothetical protein [Bradyrhizobium liaoningense]MBR0902696.1 hypothetical protein [Bradyrhizobium liaoningense]
MKVFWAWQSDHPREISRDVIRTALEAAIEQLKQERDVVEAPEESRSDLHLDHDTKGLRGSPDVARSILEKIQASTVFVGDLTPVGKTPDIEGNEGIKPGRPLINSNVAIEYGFALRKLTDSAVIGVLNEAFGDPKDLPFDIIHKRWPIRYRLVEGATKKEIDVARNTLKGHFVTALKAFIDNPEPEVISAPEVPCGLGRAFWFADKEILGFSNRLSSEVDMPFRDVLYMRLIPTIPPKRPVAEAAMLKNAHRYGAMGNSEGAIPIPNHHGAMCFTVTGAANDIDALTQYFPSGEVWAINADVMRQGKNGSPPLYLVLPAEDAFWHTLEKGLDYMRNVAGVSLPIKVIAGVTGLKGRTLGVSGAVIGTYGKMMFDHVEHTMVLRDDSHDAQDEYLFQLFEKIFDQSGHERPRQLNAYLNKGTGRW